MGYLLDNAALIGKQTQIMQEMNSVFKYFGSSGHEKLFQAFLHGRKVVCTYNTQFLLGDPDHLSTHVLRTAQRILYITNAIAILIPSNSYIPFVIDPNAISQIRTHLVHRHHSAKVRTILKNGIPRGTVIASSLRVSFVYCRFSGKFQSHPLYIQGYITRVSSVCVRRLHSFTQECALPLGVVTKLSAAEERPVSMLHPTRHEKLRN